MTPVQDLTIAANNAGKLSHFNNSEEREVF